MPEQRFGSEHWKVGETTPGLADEQPSETEELPKPEEKTGSITGKIENIADAGIQALKILTISVHEWNPDKLLNTSREYPVLKVIVTFNEAANIEIGDMKELNITDRSDIKGAAWVSQAVNNTE